MKAGYKFKRTASAVALSVGIAVSGSVAFQLASVASAEAAVVSRIEVRGNQRVDAETVRGYIGIRPGQNFSSTDVDEAVKRLFSTGLFSDVRISQSGGALVVVVDEHSSINQVLFQGNRKIKDQELAARVQSKARGSYSRVMAEADVEMIREAYRRIGRDGAQVSVTTQQIDGNRVNVIFQIDEGDRTKIADINFDGNNAFSDGRLRDVIATKRSNILSFLTRNDVYDPDRMRADEEALRRFYYNRGYADFQVVSSDAQFDDAKNEYTVSFTVDEGERYTFGDIAVESTIPGVDTASLRGLLDTRSGSVYSAKNVEDSVVAITEQLAGKGYAFAQVTPRGDRDFSNRTISVLYTVDEGARAYVERIEIRGNTKTRDYVIRREFDLNEGDAFNQVLIQRAKRRLEALDYFTSVEVSTAPGSAADQVVLVIDVNEKATGELSIGGGYTTGSTPDSGFNVEGGVGERNFLGRGQAIRVSFSGGSNSRDYMLSFTEPYFLGQRISAGFDIYRQTRNYDYYRSAVTGGTVRFGLPITENFSTQVAYNYAVEKYDFRAACDPNDAGYNPATCNSNLSQFIRDAINNQGSWTKSSISGSLVYNSIDNMQNPREGIYANFTTEVAGLGGDARWVKFTGRGNYYKTLSEEMDLVGLLVVGGGHLQSFGGRELRVFNYFQSNDRIIRGFAYNGIGPYDTATNDHLGGRTYLHASAELQFPIPIVPESIGFRGALFADAATLYGNSLGTPATVGGTDMKLRASVGASLIWASPFGPLRVDYAIPVKKEASDKVQNFNFGISTRF